MRALRLGPVVLFLAASLAAAQQDQKEPYRFRDEEVRLRETKLEWGRKNRVVEIGVHRWGRVPKNPDGTPVVQKFTVTVPAPPNYLEHLQVLVNPPGKDRAAGFVTGTALEFGPEEDTRLLRIRFDTPDPGSPVAQQPQDTPLVIEIVSQDNGVFPMKRRLILPFDTGVLAGRAITVLPIKADAPKEFPLQDAIDYCDRDRREVLIYDRVAMFFTPARDIQPPLKGKTFFWRLDKGDHEDVRRGKVELATLDGKDADPSPFAKAGSPGKFVAVIDLWDRARPADPAKRKLGPGTYTLKTIGAKGDGGGIFGVSEPEWIREEGEWQEEGTLRVSEAVLNFQGFVMEPVTLKPFPVHPALWEGKWTIRNAGNGSDVNLAVEASWRAATTWNQRDPQTGRYTKQRKPADVETHLNSSIHLEFPKSLDPGALEMGVMDVKVERPAEFDDWKDKTPWVGGGTVFVSYGIQGLVPFRERPPARTLVMGKDPPVSWGGVKRKSEDDRFWAAKRDQLDYLSRGAGAADPFQVAFRLSSPRGERIRYDAMTPVGSPKRPFMGHFVDEQSLWAAPVIVRLVIRSSYGGDPVYYRTAVGYALYGAKAVRYDGPMPLGPGDDPGANAPDPAAAGGNNAGNDPNVPGGNAGAGTAGGNTAGTGPAGSRVDPATVNPNAPDVAPVIREWVAVAEPPENATLGANLHYNEWGLKLGRVPGGIITGAPGKPDDVGARTSEQYLWDQRDSLDSVNHCTLGEYVVEKLSGGSFAHCRNRYREANTIPGVGSDAGDDWAGGDGEALAPGTAETIAGNAASDAAPAAARNETDQKFGGRGGLDDPRWDEFWRAIGNREREKAVGLYRGLTGADRPTAEREVDRLLAERTVEDEFNGNSAPLDVPFNGNPPGNDGDFLRGAGVNPGLVGGRVAAAPPPDAPARAQVTPPPPPGRPPGDPFGRARRDANARIQSVVRSQGSTAAANAKVADDIVRNHPIPTRGGMQPLDVGGATRVSLKVFDHGSQDGDRVKISVGGRVLAQDLSLLKAGHWFDVPVTGAFTTITVIALNEGTSPPNTATLEVYVGRKKITQSRWDIKTYQMGSTVIRRSGR